MSANIIPLWCFFPFEKASVALFRDKYQKTFSFFIFFNCYSVNPVQLFNSNRVQQVRTALHWGDAGLMLFNSHSSWLSLSKTKCSSQIVFGVFLFSCTSHCCLVFVFVFCCVCKLAKFSQSLTVIHRQQSEKDHINSLFCEKTCGLMVTEPIRGQTDLHFCTN